ncbi:ABC transporter ATP-binding protein [Ignavibacteria bacterium CHB1]|nr:MAG: ABC transporter ATP-binding protein [Chlorobiota bacterium]MBV6397740.1 putative ABC transporter ATP-binding protein YxlF [Ignavibacteria bacterium]MCC6885520.1 ABC transporter ATP-binding protein [Ignavibacteriales bacterium]MCE7952871.1 ABC transporter ATP-binding protein [Chlorobi bacterium CHB7]MDL1886962.1 ABC transporter ATP-binding protein [Ignavibacteria bacterium CHB1]RIK49628.1 MAG: copper ABC transporter ATP-binding protein [Ignavibacteriota bacterium]
MISLKNLTKSYGIQSALDNVSIDFYPGEITAIMGPNGSGKSTLLKTILGLVIPTSGDVLYDNVAVTGKFLYRKNLGYMPQVPSFPPALKVKEVLKLINELRNDYSPDETMAEYFGINQFIDKRISELSGGMKQRVSAAIAFMYSPKVIILDEPGAGLDPLSSHVLSMKIQEERQKKKTVILTSHSLKEVSELADRIIYLSEGKITFDKPFNEMNMELLFNYFKSDEAVGNEVL